MNEWFSHHWRTSMAWEYTLDTHYTVLEKRKYPWPCQPQRCPRSPRKPVRAAGSPGGERPDALSRSIHADSGTGLRGPHAVSLLPHFAPPGTVSRNAVSYAPVGGGKLCGPFAARKHSPCAFNDDIYHLGRGHAFRSSCVVGNEGRFWSFERRYDNRLVWELISYR